MQREELIEKVRKYPLSIESHSERFKIISDYVNVNEICFRDVNDIHFVGNTMWIDKASIEVTDVKKFKISETEQYTEDGYTKSFKVTENDE